MKFKIIRDYIYFLLFLLQKNIKKYGIMDKYKRH
jgi:hypothetical protein